MPRLQAINPQEATGQTKQLLDAVSEKFGMVPNLIRTLANSPAALQGYLALGDAVRGGVLSAKLREQISLTVSELNGCEYCVAAHSAIGKSVGLSETELADARQFTSPDSKVEAALQFAQRVVTDRGWVSDEDLDRVRRAGYGDAEIAEIVAVVALLTFSNYFNHVADTKVDFPPASVIAAN